MMDKVRTIMAQWVAVENQMCGRTIELNVEGFWSTDASRESSLLYFDLCHTVVHMIRSGAAIFN